MSKKIPKPPWVNHITRRDLKAYVTELPAYGAKHAYYNIIGTDVWVEWVNDKWVRVNPAWVHAEYEVAFWCSTDMYTKLVSDLAAHDYIECAPDQIGDAPFFIGFSKPL
jgi:hypothetical protein